MADKYDSNGDYGSGYTGEVFKRKSSEIDKRPGGQDIDEHREREREHEHANDDDHDEPHITGASHKVNEYMSELLAEKQLIDPHKFHNAARLIDQEITKVQAMNRVPARDHKYVDIYRERPIKVSAKVLVPVREHPKFNFVGKLLGPKGNSMKRLQEETMCKMAVLGRGSMKDRAKEEELRASCDPKYAHLSDDLHVEISALGPPAEAHARVAFALAEVRKYLVPDNNDNIRQEQMREMDIMGGVSGGEEVITGPVYRSVRRGVSSMGHHGSMRGEYTSDEDKICLKKRRKRLRISKRTSPSHETLFKKIDMLLNRGKLPKSFPLAEDISSSDEELIKRNPETPLSSSIEQLLPVKRDSWECNDEDEIIARNRNRLLNVHSSSDEEKMMRNPERPTSPTDGCFHNSEEDEMVMMRNPERPPIAYSSSVSERVPLMYSSQDEIMAADQERCANSDQERCANSDQEEDKMMINPERPLFESAKFDNLNVYRLLCPAEKYCSSDDDEMTMRNPERPPETYSPSYTTTPSPPPPPIVGRL